MYDLLAMLIFVVCVFLNIFQSLYMRIVWAVSAVCELHGISKLNIEQASRVENFQLDNPLLPSYKLKKMCTYFLSIPIPSVGAVNLYPV